ncbi:MAG: PQQ-binding-like beta-propeller repeat protein [Bacteroidota bacterium]
MKKTISACLLGACLLLLLPFTSEAQTAIWPQFRGVNSSGIASENQNPPVHFGPESQLLWSTNLSKGCSSPCIWGDCIFLTGCEEEGKRFQMYCINRSNGSVTWNRELAVDSLEAVHRVSYTANATPATDGERVVFYFSSCGLQCLDMKGELMWEKKMPIPESRHGMGTSPVIAGDLVILNCFGHANAPCLLALNKFNGELAWKHDWQVKEGEWGDAYSTPVVYQDQVIIYRSADVSSYDIQTGDQIWAFQVNMGDAVCTPVAGKELLFVTVFSTLGNTPARVQFPDFAGLLSEYDENQDRIIDKDELTGFEINLYPEKGMEVSVPTQANKWFGYFDHNGDSFIDSSEWTGLIELCASSYLQQGIKAFRLDGKGDITLSKLVWNEREHVPHVTSPLYYRDKVYMIKSGGILSCFRAESGDLLYSQRIGAAGAYFASPVAAGGKIYFTARNGVITVIEDGEELNILASNDLDEIISATPAIVDNKVYVRTDAGLYAFGIDK